MKPVEFCDAEAGLRDEVIDTPIQIAAASDYPLDRSESILPGGDLLILASPMVQKEEPPGRFEHAADFQEGFDRIGNGAERPGADDVVERSIVKRERFCSDSCDVDRKRDKLAPLRHTLRQEPCRIHSMQP
jgi:hypothetical protein